MKADARLPDEGWHNPGQERNFYGFVPSCPLIIANRAGAS
jgi:hypothetical protein